MNKRYFNQIIYGEDTNHSVDYYKSIDWNQIEDALDKANLGKINEPNFG